MPDIPDPLTIDPATVDSAVLRRLVAEVQEERAALRDGVRPHAYDRVHSRHNRGSGGVVYDPRRPASPPVRPSGPPRKPEPAREGPPDEPSPEP